MGLAPSNSSNSSSAEGFSDAARGRSSFATSVARARKVARGIVTPRLSWIFFWTDSTAARETDTATEVRAGGAGILSSTTAGVGSAGLGGGAILMLLRSRCWMCAIRAASVDG